MKFPPSVIKPISQSIPKPRFISQSQTQPSIELQVEHILKHSNPIEKPLERLAPYFSSALTTTVLKNQHNVVLGFRFFNWAMRRKQHRSWDSHNFMIDMLVRENGFDSVWEMIAQIKKDGVFIVPQAFVVLISAYAKTGAVDKSFETFSRMPEFGTRPDGFTYNCILDLLVKKEVYILALAVYYEMIRSETCKANSATYVILISGLCKGGKTAEALELFDEMEKKGISANNMIYTVVISALCRANRIDDAFSLFEKIKLSGIPISGVTYNVIIDGFCKAGRIDEIVDLVNLWKEEGFVLGYYGYCNLINGMFATERFNEACEWYEMLLKENVEITDCYVYTIMIKGYTEAGKVDDTLKFLNEMNERGLVPDAYFYNTLIHGFCDVGRVDDAQALKLEISKQEGFIDSVTYTVLICGLCKKGLVQEALEAFEEMERHGFLPSVMAFNALIRGLFKIGKLKEAQMLFYKMEIGRNPSLFLRLSQGAERVLDSASLQTLVERLVKAGLLVKAYKLLKQLADSGCVPNIFTYNVLINGFCKSGNIDNAFKLYKEIQIKGLSPDVFTYGTLIDGLQMVNREEDALKLFYQMEKDGCVPNLAVYLILMKCFCRKQELTVVYSLWMKYLRKLCVQDNETLKRIDMMEKNFDLKNVELAVCELLRLEKCSNADPSLYSMFLIGLCQSEMGDEAFKIFNVLRENKIDITSPSYVFLINLLCKEKKVDQALHVFIHTLEKRIKLGRPVCSHMIKFLYSQEKIKDILGLSSRMESAGYNLYVNLSKKAKKVLIKCGYITSCKLSRTKEKSNNGKAREKIISKRWEGALDSSGQRKEEKHEKTKDQIQAGDGESLRE